MTINIVGDFYSPKVDGIQFGSVIQSKMDKADLNVVNFEGPVSVNGAKASVKSGPNISQDSHAPEFLRSHGFNVFSLANNHSMDYGEKALETTIDSLSGDTVVGAGSWDEAYQVKIVSVDGTKVGFLALTQYEFGILDDAIYCRDKKGAAWIGHPDVDELIVNAKKKCDYLIILPHAGLEYFTLPLPELRTLYRHFLDLGADAVIGVHPHVPQPCEQYKNKPIAYSLGNFCFDEESERPLWAVGLMAVLNIGDLGISMSLLPLHFDQRTRTIEIVDEEQINEKLGLDQNTFLNEESYLNTVNAHCLSMQPHYEMLLEMSGYSKLSVKHCLGYIKRRLLGKILPTSDTHFVNCVRCEPHRWVLSRIFELTK